MIIDTERTEQRTNDGKKWDTETRRRRHSNRVKFLTFGYQLKIKQVDSDDDDNFIVEGLAAVYGNVDSSLKMRVWKRKTGTVKCQ